MAKLRDDLVGVVHIGGGVFSAGDEIPADANVSAGLLAPEHVIAPEPAKDAPKRRARKGAADVGDS